MRSYGLLRRRSQVVRQRSAKPLFVGSIPTGASGKEPARAGLSRFCPLPTARSPVRPLRRVGRVVKTPRNAPPCRACRSARNQSALSLEDTVLNVSDSATENIRRDREPLTALGQIGRASCRERV